MKKSLLLIVVFISFSCKNGGKRTIDQKPPLSDTSMNATALINHIKLAINPKFQDWVLFSNGTYIILPDSLKQDPENNAIKIMKEFGPVHAGGPAGDFSIIKLDHTDGWSVSGHYYGMYTYVHPDELKAAGIEPEKDVEIGLFGRSKRNKDGEECKIIYISRQ